MKNKQEYKFPKTISKELGTITTYVFSKLRGITALQIQWVIYNSQIEWIKKYKKPLFEDRIIMLDFGNVIDVLYENYQWMFFNFTDKFHEWGLELDEQVENLLCEKIEEVKKIDTTGYDIEKLGNKDKFFYQKQEESKTINKGVDESWRTIELLKK